MSKTCAFEETPVEEIASLMIRKVHEYPDKWMTESDRGLFNVTIENAWVNILFFYCCLVAFAAWGCKICICQIVPIQVSWGIWCTSLSLWKDISAISALDLGVHVSGQALMGYDPLPEDQYALEANALFRGEHWWLCWPGLCWREVTRKLELDGPAAWASRGDCPGGRTIFPLLRREVPHLFAWITDCFKHQKSLLGECNYLSLRWISLLLARPFFLQTDLPMELRLNSSRLSFPSSMCWGLYIHYMEVSFIFILMLHTFRNVMQHTYAVLCVSIKFAFPL